MDKTTDVNTYISNMPAVARPHFDVLRKIATSLAPQANEVLSYGIIGYKVDNKRARVFISGYRDHVAIYPVPNDEIIRSKLQPYIRGKGTLWFSLAQPLPKSLIEQAIKSLLK